jgi:hypothetical protein
MCEAMNPWTESGCLSCGQPFLAGMKGSEKPLLVLPVVGDVGALSRGQRAGLASALVAVVLVPLALITLLLTGKSANTAPASTPGTSPAVTQPGGTTGDGTPVAQ